jgi:hypothetical protein
MASRCRRTREPGWGGGDMTARLKKRDQEEYVLRRAKELAESGRFSGWMGIQFELRYGEGFELAHTWLDYPPLRAELDNICQEAKTKTSP